MKKIKTSEEQFRQLVLQAPVAICVLRGENYIVEVINENMCELWGKTMEQTLHKQVFDLLPELRGQSLKELLDNVYHTSERFVSNELPLNLMRNGKLETIYLKFVYEPLREADGTISGVMALAHEITEQVLSRKKIEESEEQFSTLAENMENLAWIADGEGFIYWYNKRWYDYTGTTLEEMKGWGWQKVHHPDHVERIVDFVKVAWYKNEAFELTFPLRGADGEYKWFLTRAYPIANEQGKVIRWIGTNTNIDKQKKTESEIEYRKALLEAHNEASMDGILLVDAQGKILSYNKRFIEIWKMPKHIVDAKDDEAALSFAMTQLVNPAQFIEKVKYLYENPTKTTIDLLEFNDGKIIQRHGYPVIATDGSYYAWSWAFRDITEIKKAELVLKKSEENFRQMAELMPDKKTTADPTGAVTYYSKNWEEYTGISKEQLYKEGWAMLMHADEVDAIKKSWQHSVDTGDNFEMEFRMRDKAGEYQWHLSRASAVKDEVGKIIKWIGSMTQIQRLKEEDQRKDDFLKMVSHELKTPVTSIKGYVQLLLSMLKERQETPSAFLETPLVRIDNQIGRLGTLISEMLDLSRLDTGKLELQKETFCLEELVTETIQDITFTHTNHIVKYSGKCNARVYGDRNRIGQVIINLVNNAIKYSPNNNRIDLHIEARAHNTVAVSITDYGIGIDKEHQQKIFERFYRADGESEKNYAGFGIGLFIAAEIIERHQGVIELKSEKNKGSTFTVVLPLATETKQ